MNRDIWFEIRLILASETLSHRLQQLYRRYEWPTVIIAFPRVILLFLHGSDLPNELYEPDDVTKFIRGFIWSTENFFTLHESCSSISQRSEYASIHSYESKFHLLPTKIFFDIFLGIVYFAIHSPLLAIKSNYEYVPFFCNWRSFSLFLCTMKFILAILQFQGLSSTHFCFNVRYCYVDQRLVFTVYNITYWAPSIISNTVLIQCSRFQYSFLSYVTLRSYAINLFSHVYYNNWRNDDERYAIAFLQSFALDFLSSAIFPFIYFSDSPSPIKFKSSKQWPGSKTIE